MNPAKRRRLDQSSSALSKPFKSPMRVDVRKNLQTHNRTELQKPPSLSKLTTADLSPQPLPSEHLSANKAPPSPGPKFRNTKSLRPTDQSTPATEPIGSSSASSRKSTQHLSLQKRHSSLLLQLSQLRSSLDTATQALQIESSPADAELEALITKWLLASRDAAEELFRSARDRVNRMGGLGAWRERTKSRPWDEQGDTFVGDDGEDVPLSEEQKEMREIQKEELESERKRYGGAEEEGKDEDEADDDGSFTMDMMLRQLGVDLDLIGYDKPTQRWI